MCLNIINKMATEILCIPTVFFRVFCIIGNLSRLHQTLFCVGVCADYVNAVVVLPFDGVFSDCSLLFSVAELGKECLGLKKVD